METDVVNGEEGQRRLGIFLLHRIIGMTERPAGSSASKDSKSCKPGKSDNPPEFATKMISCIIRMRLGMVPQRSAFRTSVNFGNEVELAVPLKRARVGLSGH